MEVIGIPSFANFIALNFFTVPYRDLEVNNEWEKL